MDTNSQIQEYKKNTNPPKEIIAEIEVLETQSSEILKEIKKII